MIAAEADICYFAHIVNKNLSIYIFFFSKRSRI